LTEPALSSAAAVIETERLRLEPLTAGDAPALFPSFSDPATMRHWHTRLHATPDDTRSEIEAMISRARACWWAVRERAGERRAVGFVGFHGDVRIPGIGYLVAPDQRRRGFAAEATRAAIAHGFGPLGYERIELWTHEENAGSRALATRLGFAERGRFAQRYPADADPRETVVYGLTRSEWAGEPRRRGSLPLYDLQPILSVVDVGAAVAWYESMLGFGVDFIAGDPPELAIVSRGEWSATSVRIHLRRAAAAVRQEIYLLVGAGIDDLFAHVRARGARIRAAVDTRPWGMREFTIEDLDGHALRFGAPA
jgi:[ribosomal protein S5]-alanine N-acetyltransferase